MVDVQYVLRRSNGYFIYSTADCGVGCGTGEPARLKLGPDGPLIPGLDDVLTGMRPGGKRRALVPPALGYDGRPGGEPQPPEYGQRRQARRRVAATGPLRALPGFSPALLCGGERGS